MPDKILVLIFIVIGTDLYVTGCLITNCPVGGKRSGDFVLSETRSCNSCGPRLSGQCFGPHICCGPFGCLMGTMETARCKPEDNLLGREDPCLPNGTPCRKNTGKCAAENICCSQDACFTDTECRNDDKQDNLPGINLLTLLSKYRTSDINEK